MSGHVQVTIDCADPARLAGFWAAALEWQVQDPPPGYDSWEAFLRERGVPESMWNSASAVIDPGGSGPRLFFQRVPEPKTGKNRVHLDLGAGGGPGVPLDEQRTRVAAAVDRLVGLGATAGGPCEGLGVHWVVMADPEGNEFCA